MSSNPLEMAIGRLADTIRLLGGHQVGFGAGAAVGHHLAGGQGAVQMASSVGSILPSFKRLGIELFALATLVHKANESFRSAEQMRTSSPLGQRGLDRIREVGSSFLVPRAQRERVGAAVEAAERAAARVPLAEGRRGLAEKATAAARDRDTAAQQASTRALSDLQNLRVKNLRAGVAVRRQERALAAEKYVLAGHLGTPMGATIYAKEIAQSRRLIAQIQGRLVGARVKRRQAGRAYTAGVANVARVQGARRAAGTAYAGAARNLARAQLGVGQAVNAARGAALTAQGAGAAAAGMAGGRAAMLAAGTGVGMVITLGVAAFEAAKQLRALAESTLAENRSLAMFSGKIGLAFAQLEVGDIHRGFRKAAIVEGSAVRLAAATGRMRNDWLRYDANMQVFRNNIATVGAVFSGNVGNMASNVTDFIANKGPGVWDRIINPLINLNDRAGRAIGGDWGVTAMRLLFPVLGVLGDIRDLLKSTDERTEAQKLENTRGDLFALGMMGGHADELLFDVPRIPILGPGARPGMRFPMQRRPRHMVRGGRDRQANRALPPNFAHPAHPGPPNGVPMGQGGGPQAPRGPGNGWGKGGGFNAAGE